MEKAFIQSLSSLLSSSRKIVIIPHKNPDGDAIGSTLALKHFLTKKGHQASVVSPNDYPSFLEWLPGEEHILKYTEKSIQAKKLIAEADIIFTLDFNDLSRIDVLSTLVELASATVVMIDHHENPKGYAQLTYSDTLMSSTCEMVYNVIEALDQSAFTAEIATCLYTGIMTDTGSFKYQSTTSKTHTAIATLINAGAQNTTIHQNIYDTFSFDRIKLLGLTLSSMKKIEGLPVVYMALDQALLNGCNFKRGDIEGFVNYGLSLEGIQVAVILIENEGEGKIKMSFRSKGDFSVNDFARKYFNGGGHLNASGGMSMKTLEETEKDLVAAIKLEKNNLIIDA